MTSTALQNPPVAAAGMAPLAASALQKLLPDLLALSLDAKQAHWNVTGPAFLTLHALTDQIAADAIGWADRVAERALALGFAVDGRPATVAASASPFLAGRLGDREATDELGALLGDVAAAARAALDVLAHADAVGHEIVVSVLEGLEKHRWMLHAQTA
ncbi:MAG: ferritin-like domain-containing protein [Acidimicrobiales bacterium]